jgi:hypothetical protein
LLLSLDMMLYREYNFYRKVKRRKRKRRKMRMTS